MMMENPLAIFLISKEFAYIAANRIQKKSNKAKIFDFLLYEYFIEVSSFMFISLLIMQ